MSKLVKALTIGLLAYSAPVLACFDSSSFLKEHETAHLLFLFVPILILSAIGLRFIHCRERLWVPLLAITSFMYIPGFIWLQSAWNSGDCGLGVIQAKWLMFTFALILLALELLWFTKYKKAKQSLA